VPLAFADSGTESVRTKPTIVLVHGAWADGSSWNKVTTRLQAAGYEVRVPPNNLRGVDIDAADLASYLSTISGPIVLVAHSYGGMIITNAATNNQQVRSLVYVDAFIPEEGETLASLNHPPSIFAQDPAKVFDVVPYTGAPPDGVDLYVKQSVYAEAFASSGVAPRDMALFTASQRPLSTHAFDVPSGPPAWVKIPAWAVVGAKDRIIPIADQLAMAKNAGARVTQIDAPHLSMVTNDRAVYDVIVKAATGSDQVAHRTGAS